MSYKYFCFIKIALVANNSLPYKVPIYPDLQRAGLAPEETFVYPVDEFKKRYLPKNAEVSHCCLTQLVPLVGGEHRAERKLNF